MCTFAAQYRSKEVIGDRKSPILLKKSEQMITKNLVEQLVEEKIAGSPMYLVEVAVSSQNVVSVFVDSEAAITLEDCILISKWLEEKLDRESNDFELNVSSAGLSEPFKVPRQYTKHLGKKVEILSKDGIKRKGVLTRFENNTVELETTKTVKLEGKKKKQEVVEQVILPLDTIKTTKLLLTFK